MQMQIQNRTIRQFEDDLIALCNSYDLPCEIKRLALKSVTDMMTRESDKAILVEIQEEQKDAEGA